MSRGEIAWCENPAHAHKESSCEARRAPLWLLRFHPRAVRVRVRDWLWLRRHKHGAFGDYAVELGGQRFTQAQWEAVQVYAEGAPAMTHERRQRGASLPEWLAELSHRAGTKASDYFDESDYEQGRYHQGMCDAYAYAAAEARKRLEL